MTGRRARLRLVLVWWKRPRSCWVRYDGGLTRVPARARYAGREDGVDTWRIEPRYSHPSLPIAEVGADILPGRTGLLIPLRPARPPSDGAQADGGRR